MNRNEFKEQEKKRLQKEINDLSGMMRVEGVREKIELKQKEYSILMYDLDLYLKMINEENEVYKVERRNLYVELIIVNDEIALYKDRLSSIDYSNKENLKKLDEKKYDLCCKKKERILREIVVFENNPLEYFEKKEVLGKKVEDEKEKLLEELYSTDEIYDKLNDKKEKRTDEENEEFKSICKIRREIEENLMILEYVPESYFKL